MEKQPSIPTTLSADGRLALLRSRAGIENPKPESEKIEDKGSDKAPKDKERGNLQKRFDDLTRERRESQEASDRRIAALEV